MTFPKKVPPIALTIAGSDPSGGAGLQADLKTFTVMGVYGTTIVTSLTAQNTRGVTGTYDIPITFIKEQAQTLASDVHISAVKTGMLSTSETVTAVVDILNRYSFGPLVVDPVILSTSGSTLLSSDGLQRMREELLPIATLVTPNLFEASQLLGKEVAHSLSEMENHARGLLKFGMPAVLLKGGHLEHEAKAVDILATAEGIIHFSLERIQSKNTHGTGCTLSAAITAEFAKGNLNLQSAIKIAKDFVWNGLKAGQDLHIGGGRGPIDHLYAIKRAQS